MLVAPYLSQQAIGEIFSSPYRKRFVHSVSGLLVIVLELQAANDLAPA